MSGTEVQEPEAPVALKPVPANVQDSETSVASDLVELSLDDAQEEAARLKAEGNEAFKSKSYDDAIEKYSGALSALKSAGAELDAVILSNRSAAYIMLRRYVPALRDAQLAGELNPDFWKAFWRQGVALMRMTPKKFRSRAAIEAFEKCAQCSDLPEGKVGDVNAELAKARARMAEQEAETPMPEQCRPS